MFLSYNLPIAHDNTCNSGLDLGILKLFLSLVALHMNPSPQHEIPTEVKWTKVLIPILKETAIHC